MSKRRRSFRYAESNGNKAVKPIDITGKDIKIDDLAGVLRYVKAHLMVFADTSADALVGDEDDKNATLTYIKEASDKLNEVIRYALAYNAKCNKPENRDVTVDGRHDAEEKHDAEVEHEADYTQNGEGLTVRVIKVCPKDLFDRLHELLSKVGEFDKENGNND